jgi:hypothetical protein
MSQTKKYLVILIALLVPLAGASSAQAAGESVSASAKLAPKNG